MNMKNPIMDAKTLQDAVLRLRVFDRVLVRQSMCDTWEPAFFKRKIREEITWGGVKHHQFSFYTLDQKEAYRYCIPYVGNQPLVFTKDFCATDLKRGDYAIGYMFVEGENVEVHGIVIGEDDVPGCFVILTDDNEQVIAKYVRKCTKKKHTKCNQKPIVTPIEPEPEEPEEAEQPKEPEPEPTTPGTEGGENNNATTEDSQEENKNEDTGA